MDEAAVLAECAANPDDDAPRLVWADLVGGDRGELVVLQCDLARGDLSPAETATRRRRERELLETHALEWAGPLASIATRWTFRRGFIETARFTGCDAAALAAHPLISTVTIDGMNLDILAGLTRHLAMRGLALEGMLGSLAHVAPYAGGLRGLAIENLTAEAFAPARDLLARAPRLDQLWLHHFQNDDVEAHALIAAAPQVTTLVVEPAPGFGDRGDLRLDRALRGLQAPHANLATLARTSSATLERLSCTIDELGQSVDWLAKLTELRVLDIGGHVSDEVVHALARSTAFAKLRVIRIHGSLRGPEVAVLAKRFGSQLELLQIPYGMPITSTLAVAGEVRSAATHAMWRRTFTDELLHHDPSTLLALDPPWCARSRSAAMARIDQDGQEGQIWDIPSMPVESVSHIGRVQDNLIAIADSSISRRQCSLTWRDGAHHVTDLQSTNGIAVENERVQESPLVDGNELRVGAAILQYFVGPDARERATAAAFRAKTVDANTRLPIDMTPGVRVTTEITNWDGITRRYGKLFGQLVMRAVAAELRRFAAGEPITFVRGGVFGLEPATASRVGRRTLSLVVDDETIDLELATVAP